MPTFRCLLLTAALAASSAAAQEITFSPDVPTGLQGDVYLPWDFAVLTNGIYNRVLRFPAGTDVDALHLMDSGDWLFSVEVPTELPQGSGTTYGPADVVRFDGATYSLFQGGAAAGIPAGAILDAAFLNGGDTGTLVASFDVPTLLGNTLYEPADLAEWNGVGWSMFFDASAAAPAVPLSTNVTGAHPVAAGELYLAFDVPVALGGFTAVPGDLVRWNGAAFALEYRDPAWPAGSRLDALTTAARIGSGSVRTSLRMSRVTSVGPVDLLLDWSASCSGAAIDYAIYAGELGNFYTHDAIDCTDDGGDLQEIVVEDPSRDQYFLVVPLATSDEGSYGTDSPGNERPVGGTTCRTVQVTGPCP